MPIPSILDNSTDRVQLKTVLRDLLQSGHYTSFSVATGYWDLPAMRSAGEAKAILEKLDTDRRHILNPLSHNDDRNIYSQELKSAMADLERLKELLK